MKSYKNNKNKINNKEKMLDAIEDANEFVYSWKQSRLITGVLSMNKTTLITKDFKNNIEK